MSDYDGALSSKYLQKLLHSCSTRNLEMPSLQLPFANSFPSVLKIVKLKFIIDK